MAFLSLRKRIIHQETQHHTRIFLRLIKIFRFVVEVVARKHYQQKEDSYISMDCAHVFLRFAALISTAKFERNFLQEPHKRIPAASRSPDVNSILYEFVCPGNISFLSHTAKCVGVINITASVLTCNIPVY